MLLTFFLIYYAFILAQMEQEEICCVNFEFYANTLKFKP